ncbi:hypothetical protein CYMTET_18508 [Cymbomonas tetramitiformis]|uniref:Sodium-dependent multivitamin transporter n=1 Tax=Cymbomonas tetramitiformis TaxID=36881 RepID=A0AAE0L5T8_9CHLO|nr:hypothetical protein CYMTET_18508 [Cymbomonas tetramitiformis]
MLIAIADCVILALYLATTIGVGFFFSRKTENTENFFLGGRGLPGWAVGFSILATAVSSVTFLAFPATTYIIDYRLYPKDFVFPLVSIFAAYYIAPAYRRRPGCVSAFQILEDSFGIVCRLYGAFSYVLMNFLKLGTVLYLLSIPISMLFETSQIAVILGCGCFVAVYSMAGGIQAVIFTDVLQGVILLVGRGGMRRGYWGTPWGTLSSVEGGRGG